MEPGQGTLREVLRAATAPLHRQTEAALDLTGPGLTRARYLAVLRRFHAVYTRLEPAIVAHPGWAALGFSMSDRRRLPLLEEDLASLEGSSGIARRAGMAAGEDIPDIAPVADISHMAHIPHIAHNAERAPAPQSGDIAASDFPAVLGAAYVLEGSTLGGTFLHGHVARALGLEGGAGTRFFHGAGRETMARWKQFVAALERAPLDAAGRQRAVDGAAGTFALLLGLPASPAAAY